MCNIFPLHFLNNRFLHASLEVDALWLINQKTKKHTIFTAIFQNARTFETSKLVLSSERPLIYIHRFLKAKQQHLHGKKFFPQILKRINKNQSKRTGLTKGHITHGRKLLDTTDISTNIMFIIHHAGPIMNLFLLFSCCNIPFFVLFLWNMHLRRSLCGTFKTAQSWLTFVPLIHIKKLQWEQN